MKNITSLFVLFLATFFFSVQIFAQSTETFEAIADNTDSFTLGGKSFNSSDTNFDVNTFANAGAGGSDKFMDNFGFTSTAASYSITTTGALLFTLKTIEFYVSSIATGDNPTADGTMIFVGKEGGVTVFTYTKSAGFPTTFGSTNGFFTLDLANDPVSDLSNINIDQLDITLTGSFQYVAMDNFTFDDEILETDPPSVQTITVVGSPTSTATSVDFLVTFSENANNITTDDFSLDTVGTTGTIASVSASSGTSVTVTVSGISGEGTISIDVNGTNDIADDLGNSPSPSFTAGENHFVSRCFQETFESFIDGDVVFSSNGIGFTTSTTNFNIEVFVGGGAGGSDKCLSNNADEGTGKIYSITTSGAELFNVEAVDMYLSSETGGANPTNDGSVILRGKLATTTLFTITKNTGFPTNFTINNGFSSIDFATEGASDFSLTNIDELEIEIGGAFIYVALDNFEHCEELTSAAPPIVQSINLVGNPPANSASVDFDVIFNENAVNVTMDDFSVDTDGTAVGSITGIAGSANNYVITVSSISGEGSIRVDLNAGTDIEDESGNTPPDQFIEGERHLVTVCEVETYESLAVLTTDYTTNGIPFTSGATTNFSVEEFIGAGGGGSDRFLSNILDQGTGKIYSIAVTNPSSIFMNTMEVYVSSEANGENPTDDGTLTVRGKLDGATVYTITKSSGFPTSFGATHGFFTLDFATDGASDFSNTDIDEVEVELGGAFIYIAIDNFKFCEDIVAPIAVCQDIAVSLDTAGNVLVAPDDVDGGSTDNASRFHLGFELNEFSGVVDATSPTDEYIVGSPFSYSETAFTVAVDGDYIFNMIGSSTAGHILILFNSLPNHNSGEFSTRPEFVTSVAFNDDGTLLGGSPTFSLIAGHTYYLNMFGNVGDFTTFDLTVDMPIIATESKMFTCADIGDNIETLYIFDLAGNIDSCDATITVSGLATEYIAGAWNNGLPNLGSSALITDDLSTAGTSIDACSCQIDGKLTIEVGDYLQVANNIIVNGELDVQQEGSVVQTLEAATTTNNGIITVRKTTPSLGTQDFMIMGSPMTAETREAVYSTGRLVLEHITANFVPHPGVGSMFPTTENFADDNGDNWAAHTGLLNPGEGYLVRPQPDRFTSGTFDLDYTLGTLNSGVVNFPIGFNGTQNASANIMGNPYASAIDTDAFMAANAMIDAVYFWEHLTPPSDTYPGFNQFNFDMGDISSYNAGSGGLAAANGGATPGQFMASGQGFGIKASTPGTAIFNNNMRVTGPNNTYRDSELISVERDRIWLEIKNETYGLGSNILVAFVEGASNKFEAYYDTKRMATPVSLYSILEDKSELGIQGRESFSNDEEIQLGFSTQITEKQKYTISIRDIEGINITATTVYLKDKEFNTYTNLSEEDYSFITREGTQDNRFVLLFKERILDLDDYSKSGLIIGISPNPTTGIFTINSPNVQIQKVDIMDVQGRLISTNIYTNNSIEVDLSGLDSAMYFVTIYTSEGMLTKRVLKQ